MMKRLYLLLLLALGFTFVHADESDSIDKLLVMDISQLIELKVSSASGVPESLRHAPAAMIVILAEDIRQRGYDNLAEVLADVPGFDISVSNGTTYAVAQQRGYRSPFGQRTLLLVDGVVNNELWSQAPDISRQFPLQMIERIEILYGPASAVYGANAFAGVVHIITRRAENATAQAQGHWSMRAGSYQTRSVEGDVQKSFGAFKVAAGLRVFNSDEPSLDDLNGHKGFNSPRWLNDAKVWGPILKLSPKGRPLGGYYDPSEDSSLLLNFAFHEWKASFFLWQAKEGYGAEYAGDHGQTDVPWSRQRRHFYVERVDKTSLNGSLTSRISARESREWGDWAEAEPDWRQNMSEYSYVSYSHWNTRSHAWQIEQKLELAAQQDWQWLAGWKYERRVLSRAYAICGYWEPSAYCSENPNVSVLAPEGFGPWVVHSTANAIPDSPYPNSDMPADNQVYVTDRSIHLQGTFNRNGYRASLGLLHDHHSDYGTNTSPRVSLGYEFSPTTTVKALYGRAWQEPPTMQVYGGWNGRNANPDLQPERAANRELVVMHSLDKSLHELSVFSARYDNAIREDAMNASSRHVHGAEYRGRFDYDWFDRHWSAYLYYTWTKAVDSQSYDFTTSKWVDGEADIGDIAPHKVQLGVTVPLTAKLSVNVRGRYLSEREFYSRNPLRAQNETLDSYVVSDLHLQYRQAPYTISFSINNIFDTAYENTGIASANAGNDYNNRALGYYNSLLPQAGRSIYTTLGVSF